MGTRNLTCVIHNNEFKVAQYCQWDGYPSGQGQTVLSFLQDEFNREQFLERLNHCVYPLDNDLRKMWDEVGADGSGMVNMEIAGRFKQKHPTLDRDMGAGVLSYIQNSSIPTELKLDEDFAQDSLFCEWAYVIDLDKNTLEVYKGFNTEPLDENDLFYVENTEGEYQPIKLIKTYDLNDLPDTEAFVKELNTLAGYDND